MPDLIARFDAAMWNAWEPYPHPTAASLDAIEQRFRCRMPPLLVSFAQHSTRFSNFFLSLGPDISNHSHIITENDFVRGDPSWLREGPRAPDHLVLISENFMEDFFWCLDISDPNREYPVVLWAPEDRSQEPNAQHESFEQFMRFLIEHYERATLACRT